MPRRRIESTTASEQVIVDRPLTLVLRLTRVPAQTNLAGCGRSMPCW
jgi:hypothetical protein